MKSMQQGWIYAVTNPAYPGYVKIGWSEKEDVQDRIDGLYTSGLLEPFTLHFAKYVANPYEWEQKIHKFFAEERVRPNREYFGVHINKVYKLFEFIPGEWYDTDDTSSEKKSDDRLREPAKDMRMYLLDGEQIGYKTIDNSPVFYDAENNVLVRHETGERYSTPTKYTHSVHACARNNGWRTCVVERDGQCVPLTNLKMLTSTNANESPKA